MPALSFSADSSPYQQQQHQHQHQSSSAQPSLSSQSSSSFSREMLYPLERFVVQVLILIGTVLVRGALWFFELIIKNWTSANQKLHQRKQKKQQIPDNKQMLLPTLNTNNNNNNKNNTASSSSSSFPSVSSFNDNNNNSKNKNNNSKSRNDDDDDDKKKNCKNNNNNAAKVDDDNAICMAHMLAAGVLPYYLASECTNAMMRPLDQELSDASSSSSDEVTAAAASASTSSAENHSQNTNHPTKQQKSSSSSSSNHNTHSNQHSTYSVITKVVADGSAKFRVLFHSPPTTTAAPTRRQKQHNAVDGILLVVGSSSQSDEVDSNDCNAPVLGGIAAQLAESCSAVGSLAVVSARVDFLAKPEPLSDAVDRFERLCSAVCAAFPTARGPLIILARHVTASLVLHAVVRATSTEEESSSSSSSSSSDQDDDDNDHGTSPNTTSTCKSGTNKNPFNFLQQTPLTQSSKNNSKEDLGGLFPHVAEEEQVPTQKKNRNRLNGKKRPSLKRAAIIIFSPFVGWNIIEKMKKSCDNKQQVLPITPDRQRSSDELFGETPDRMSSNDDGVNTTASVSHQITPQHSPQKNSFLNNNNNNKNNNNNDDDEYFFDDQGEQVLLCNNDLSYDEDMFERFEEAGSYLTGMSATSAANRNNSSKNNNQDGGEGENNNDNAHDSNQQKTSSSSPTSAGEGRIFKMLRPSFYYQKFRASSQEIASNIAHTVDFVVKNATRPDKWKLSRLFKWRIRSVCSQLWTKMQEEAPKVFSPLLIDWFPATAIRFLHPTIRAFVVCDSAAPYSVETLHWARGLVSQGCNVRLIEWSSQASKDPYSEFQARIVNNEATDWVRDLLLEVAQQQQQQHHHQNANHQRHHQNNNNNSNKTKFPPIWENNNFSYTLADGTTNHHQHQHHCQNRQNPKEEFTIVEGVRSEVQTANEDDNAYDDGKSNTNTMQHQQQNRSYFQRNNNNNNNHNVSNNSSFAVASQQHYYHDHQDAAKSNNNNDNNHQRRGSSLGGISLPSPPYGARSVTAPQPNTAPTTNRPMFPTGPNHNNNHHHQQPTALPPHQNQVRVLYQNNFLNTSSQNRAPLCKHKNHNNDDDDEEDNEENDKEQTYQQNNRNTTGIHASSASEDDGGEVEDEKKKQLTKKMRKKTNSGSSLSSSPISPQPHPQQQQQHSVAAAEVQSRSRGASSTSQQRQQNDNTNSDGNNNNSSNNTAPKIRHVDSLDRWSMHASEFGN